MTSVPVVPGPRLLYDVVEPQLVEYLVVWEADVGDVDDDAAAVGCADIETGEAPPWRRKNSLMLRLFLELGPEPMYR